MSSEYVRSWKLTAPILMNPDSDQLSTLKSRKEILTDVQYRIRNQLCGRRGTSMEKRTKSKQIYRERTLSSKYVSVTSNQVSNFTTNDPQSNKNPKLIDENVTLADICSLASHVADKIRQRKQKADLEAMRGFRLPSTRVDDVHYPKKTPLIRNIPIRLVDILPKNDDSNESEQQENTSF